MRYSIITINFNNANGLNKTIESVVNQNYNNFEYIVIDGGSTDNSITIIQKYNDKISYWVSEPDKGIYNAMNKGISFAHGDYCIFMNSGDCFYSNDVLSQLSLFDADIVVGKVLVESQNRINYLQQPQSLFHVFLYTPHQGALIKTKLQRKYLYDEKYKVISDRKFFLQVTLTSKYKIISENIIMAIIEPDIRTNNHRSIGSIELKQMFCELLPSSLWYDFEMFHNSQCNMSCLMPELKRMPQIDNFLCKITLIIIKMRKLYRSLFSSIS